VAGSSSTDRQLQPADRVDQTVAAAAQRCTEQSVVTCGSLYVVIIIIKQIKKHAVCQPVGELQADIR